MSPQPPAAAAIEATPAVLSLAAIDGANGFRIDGYPNRDNSGIAVASAGDANGDGIADVWVSGGDAAAVVLGRSGVFPPSLDLLGIGAEEGFRLSGLANGVPAGDVNGDGFADFVSSDRRFDWYEGADSGVSRVVFGTATGVPRIDRGSDLDGHNGFAAYGTRHYQRTGTDVGRAGDFNGDGIDDLLIVARPGDHYGYSSGDSYVVYGIEGARRASLELETMPPRVGVHLLGVGSYYGAGVVTSAGDVNGDGFDDLVFGASDAQFGDLQGEAWVVFGAARLREGPVPDRLNGNDGFRVTGFADYSFTGNVVAGAGDLNGDGFDDIVVGTNDFSDYVIFGAASGFGGSFDVESLDGSNGFRMHGSAAHAINRTFAGAGDFNGDGLDDLVVGVSHDRGRAGSTYVVFGTDAGFPADLDITTLDGTNGLRIDGGRAGDWSGASVAAAGDVNADGFDDIVIGAPRGDASGLNSGQSYVVFGFAGGTPRLIEGGPWRDVLRGHVGNDEFHPGGGRDRVTTGRGEDTVVFGQVAGRKDVLRITDFDPASDHLDLDGASVARVVHDAQGSILVLEGADVDRITLVGVFDTLPDLI
jgi:hypothetical protein